jgi:hypothetical protein
MASIDAGSVTNLEGGLIALGFAIACLLLRALLLSPRLRLPRLVLPPRPTVLRRSSSQESSGAPAPLRTRLVGAYSGERLAVVARASGGQKRRVFP